MEINHKFDHVEGAFETDTGELVCVERTKYKEVVLCFRANMNIPFAEIKLYSSELAADAKAVLNDAYKLGEEIVRRWNENKPSEVKPIDVVLFCPNCYYQHIDEANPLSCQECGAGKDDHNNQDNGTCPEFAPWLNPPHKKHRCYICNHVWRPANVPTNGVKEIK